MPTRRNNPVEIVDDEVVSIARRYRVESVATLIAVCRDDEASASARAAAASKLLEYSDGKPGVARTITRADMASLPDETKKDLFDWLLLYFTGTGLEPLLQELGLLGQPALPPAKTKKTKNAHPVPNRFTRGPVKQKPRHVPDDWPQHYRPARVSATERQSPAPSGPPEGLKAVPASTIAANPEQASARAGQDGDHRLTPTPSSLPRLGLAEHLPNDLTRSPQPVLRDAYGNIVNLAALRPQGSS